FEDIFEGLIQIKGLKFLELVLKHKTIWGSQVHKTKIDKMSIISSYLPKLRNLISLDLYLKVKDGSIINDEKCRIFQAILQMPKLENVRLVTHVKFSFLIYSQSNSPKDRMSNFNKHRVNFINEAKAKGKLKNVEILTNFPSEDKGEAVIYPYGEGKK